MCSVKLEKNQTTKLNFGVGPFKKLSGEETLSYSYTIVVYVLWTDGRYACCIQSAAAPTHLRLTLLIGPRPWHVMFLGVQ